MITFHSFPKARGPLFTPGASIIAIKPLQIVQEIAKVVENTAKEDYMSKRKTDKLPSLIFSSISFEIKEGNLQRAQAIVFAGGPKNDNPPYTRYVHDGHKLRNGEFWKGYKFMEVGAAEGRRQAKDIARRILNFR